MTASEIIESLKKKYPKTIEIVSEPVSGKYYVRAAKEALPDASDYLVNQCGARYVISSGTDRRPNKGSFEVMHVFSLDKQKSFVALQAAVTDPAVPSITPRVPAANWAEREFYDLVGIKPEGHPDPRRLVLSDDWPQDVHPLRRDFPHDFRPESVTPDYKAMFKEPPEGTTVVPVGPFYPVLEEPCQVRLFVDGEKVVDCDYRGFYSHRGIEKLGSTALTYNRVPFIAERICGICGYVHSTCYCEAVEEAGNIETPLRAKYIRTIILELERIHSHLLWLGIAAHIIGFDTVLMQSWRIREPVMWLCEKITGNRKNYGMNLVGGVRRDIPSVLHEEMIQVLDKMEKETRALVAVIPGDTTLAARLKGVGVLTEEDAKKFAVVGPPARASNIDIDARRDHPYAAYDKLDFEVPVVDSCDIYGRVIVRMEELFQTFRILRQALKDMPDGPIRVDIPEEIPAGHEALRVVEAPRGESFHYVLTGEENKPERWRVRAPTYPNLQILPTIIQDETIADVPISLGSLDPCFSCTERMEISDVNTGSVKVWTNEELLKLSRGR